MYFIRILALALTTFTVPSFVVHGAQSQAGHISENEVIEIVLSLPDVKEFKRALDKNGRSKLGIMVEEAPSKRSPHYVIKVYESFPDRIVTFHRYRYTPSTKEIAVQDLSSDREWKIIKKADNCTGERISQQFSITVHKDFPKISLTLFKQKDRQEPDSYAVGCVEVYWGKESVAKQTLKASELLYAGYNQDRAVSKDDIRNDDYNLDGYNDLSILTAEGAHGENAEFWLWNPNTQLFERNEYLSRDMNVEVNQEQRVIWTHGANNAYDNSTNEYLLDHGKVVWVLNVEQQKTGPVSEDVFPVTRKYKIPIKNRMKTVLTLRYDNAEQFEAPCARCQSPQDLLGCKLLGYGKVVGRINAGTEILAFETPQKDSVCTYYPTVSDHPLRVHPKSSVNLKGQ